MQPTLVVGVSRMRRRWDANRQVGNGGRKGRGQTEPHRGSLYTPRGSPYARVSPYTRGGPAAPARRHRPQGRQWMRWWRVALRWYVLRPLRLWLTGPLGLYRPRTAASRPPLNAGFGNPLREPAGMGTGGEPDSPPAVALIKSRPGGHRCVLFPVPGRPVGALPRLSTSCLC